MELCKIRHKSGIYIISNLINGNCYVGSAVYIRGRYANHIKNLKRGTHKNIYLQNSWNKYGEDCFSFDVVIYCDKENLLFFEQCAIDSYVKNNKRNSLYNIELIAGSGLGRKLSFESKKKIGDGRRGKLHSKETIEMYKITRKGMPVSEAAKLKISEKMKGRIITPEWRKKISESNMGRAWSDKQRKKFDDSIRKKRES